MKTLRKIYYRIFKRYRRLDSCFVSYAEGDRLIRLNAGWVIAPEEDQNHAVGMGVYLEKRERITT